MSRQMNRCLFPSISAVLNYNTLTNKSFIKLITLHCTFKTKLCNVTTDRLQQYIVPGKLHFSPFYSEICSQIEREQDSLEWVWQTPCHTPSCSERPKDLSLRVLAPPLQPCFLDYSSRIPHCSLKTMHFTCLPLIQTLSVTSHTTGHLTTKLGYVDY